MKWADHQIAQNGSQNSNPRAIAMIRLAGRPSACTKFIPAIQRLHPPRKIHVENNQSSGNTNRLNR
jgi:hypothetical protein